MPERPILLVVGIALLATSCRRDEPPPAPAVTPPPLAADVFAHTPDASEPPDEPKFEGEPVAVTPAEVLHERGEFRVERQRWKHAGRTGVAWIVTLSRNAEVAVMPSDDVVPFADLMPPDAGPWALINGGFYEALPNGPDHRPMGLVVAGGVVLNKRTRRGGSGIFFAKADELGIVHRDAFAGDGVQHALQSIDRIVDQGVSLVTKRPDQPGAPRSAIALSDDEVSLIATVADADIRQMEDRIQLVRSDKGMPLWAFAAYLVDRGANEALNLDGGVSTQLAARDQDFVLDVRGVDGTINALVARPR